MATGTKRAPRGSAHGRGACFGPAKLAGRLGILPRWKNRQTQQARAPPSPTTVAASRKRSRSSRTTRSSRNSSRNSSRTTRSSRSRSSSNSSNSSNGSNSKSTPNERRDQPQLCGFQFLQARDPLSARRSGDSLLRGGRRLATAARQRIFNAIQTCKAAYDAFSHPNLPARTACMRIIMPAISMSTRLRAASPGPPSPGRMVKPGG